jgi:hypothetical protein
MLPLMSAMPMTDLKSAIANLANERSRIVDALDYLFLGI